MEPTPEPKPQTLQPMEWALLAALGCGVAAVVVYKLLVPLTTSLWLDEFGTLWTAEGSFGQTVERSLDFQGQSPLYYLSAWASITVLGESEWALRLPSVGCYALAVAGAYGLAREFVAPRFAAGASLVLALHPSFLLCGQIARPYALAVLFSVAFVWGFLRATQGRRWGRVLFVAGGVGLFYAHFLLALQAVGVGLAYLAVGTLRERYPWKHLAIDVGVGLLCVAPSVPQFFALNSRAGDLAWIREVFWALPLVMLFSCTPLLGFCWAWRKHIPQLAAPAQALAWIFVGQFAALFALVPLGRLLLCPRYAITVIVPACALASFAFPALAGLQANRRLRFAGALLLGAWLALAGLLYPTPLVGSWGWEWREAVLELDATVAAAPAPVCYRAGFIEEDLWVSGTPSPALSAPLRSPGRDMPRWELARLTKNWDVEGLDDYLERSVAPILRPHARFYYLGPDDGFDVAVFTAWVDQATQSTWTSRALQEREDVVVLEFVRLTDSGDRR